MKNSRGLLYPALHKFYSALSSLEKFEKGSNFFDNISHLDNFFSEYRNITFVLQKSLAKTEFSSVYEQLRDKFFIYDVGKWFIDKRNNITKEQPFDLEKRIVINIYSGKSIYTLPEFIFTIENDVEFSSIVESLREIFLNSGQIEVFFSVEFMFYERGHTKDLYDNFILGITQMKQLLSGMKKVLNEDCILSEELERRIEKMNFYRVPKDFLFVDDYVFNCKNEKFEKASRIALTTGDRKHRASIENLNQFKSDGDILSKFELMHLVIFQMQNKLMPTCMIVYSDNTFELNSFEFSIKTTVYRKFNEIAKRIEKDDIVNILFVTEMYAYSVSDIKNLDSKERIKHAKNEILSFFMIDNQLSIKSRSYDTKKINDFKYIASIMNADSIEQKLPAFMNPVKLEFARLLGIENEHNNAT
ncbi:hypothetical protein C7377_1447 [Balneicella halophila]|uniref:Uncharacterized protein n=1 Tax=Balneicella halophila TaxID=1537566 RepID=A0A7L4UMG8_BALHA|nr:hypothetical protein [Balneicella halophila]PVX49814.1 hypothetical protein C7377_1447 [Balneicella halophila]